MTEEFNFKALCDLTTRVMGLPTGSLSLRSRKRELQSARSIAAYIGLTEEKIHRTIIAKVLNRDRAVTYHYEYRHNHHFISSREYRKTFDKIYKAYKDVEGTKSIFSDKKTMKKYLLKNGVTEKAEHDVRLEVKSGRAICYINTTYFDFSNQLENIKLALENYHYTVKIF
tara:strand:- start:2695 stop:3204 length:510 start_codon:yes stop_codon:yes gene_type:complete